MDSEAEIESLVLAFEGTTLPKADWTHRAHLTVALFYLRRHPRDEATRLIREGIRRYNASRGNSAGYHETATLAWAAVVHGFLARHDPEESISALVGRLLDEGGERGYLLRFYSEGLLKSDEARLRWVPSDLRPIGSP